MIRCDLRGELQRATQLLDRLLGPAGLRERSTDAVQEDQSFLARVLRRIGLDELEVAAQELDGRLRFPCALATCREVEAQVAGERVRRSQARLEPRQELLGERDRFAEALVPFQEIGVGDLRVEAEVVIDGQRGAQRRHRVLEQGRGALAVVEVEEGLAHDRGEDRVRGRVGDRREALLRDLDRVGDASFGSALEHSGALEELREEEAGGAGELRLVLGLETTLLRFLASELRRMRFTPRLEEADEERREHGRGGEDRHAVPAHEPARAVDRARRAGKHGFAHQRAPHVRGELGSRWVAARRILLERAGEDPAQLGRNGLGQARLDLDDAARDLGQREAIELERRAAREQLAQDATERVDVAAHVDLVRSAGDVLRAHVGERAEDLAGARLGEAEVEPRRIERAGQAEVDHFDATLGIDQHVARLQVAVQHAALMAVVHRVADFREEP